MLFDRNRTAYRIQLHCDRKCIRQGSLSSTLSLMSNLHSRIATRPHCRVSSRRQKNVWPIRSCEPPLHCQSPGVASRTPAIAIAQAACDVHNDDNNDNAWQREPLWPHVMGPIRFAAIDSKLLSTDDCLTQLWKLSRLFEIPADWRRLSPILFALLDTKKRDTVTAVCNVLQPFINATSMTRCTSRVCFVIYV